LQDPIMPDSEEKTNLADSFRQSRRELWFMITSWIAFAAWTVGYNSVHAFGGETSGQDPLLGMPRWVTLGIFLPWLAALALTVWFAMRFMKDTPLHDCAVDAPSGLDAFEKGDSEGRAE
jgi:hypothetical protein